MYIICDRQNATCVYIYVCVFGESETFAWQGGNKKKRKEKEKDQGNRMLKRNFECSMTSVSRRNRAYRMHFLVDSTHDSPY